MLKNCPNNNCRFHTISGASFHKIGYFYVKRTNRYYRRYRCKHCLRSFSTRTHQDDYRHKKPDLNSILWKLLCEGTSLRAASRILGMTYYNTYKKFLWLSRQAEKLKAELQLKAETLYFDEMETIEHTKCKPVSLGLVVNENYEILDIKVARMPAKGHLAEFSRKKYGPRVDEREHMIKTILSQLSQKVMMIQNVYSDAKPSYRKWVRMYFPKARYETFSRENKEKHRSRLHEKKQKREYDPLFPLNQRCAKLRSDVKRLARRSWCTTKSVENLQKHLNLYIVGQFI